LGALVALGFRERLELLDRLVALVVRVRPAHFLAELQAVERRLADVDATLLHQRPEMAIEEGQEQGADVRAVDVRIGEQDRLAVAQLFRVEIVADARAERDDERLDLLVREHLVGARLLDVEDLAAKREDRLEAPVATGLRVAAGRDALDDDELALLGIALLAVGELPR